MIRHLSQRHFALAHFRFYHLAGALTPLDDTSVLYSRVIGNRSNRYQVVGVTQSKTRVIGANLGYFKIIGRRELFNPVIGRLKQDSRVVGVRNSPSCTQVTPISEDSINETC